jgi:hypothetical protein
VKVAVDSNKFISVIMNGLIVSVVVRNEPDLLGQSESTGRQNDDSPEPCRQGTGGPGPSIHY